MHLSRCWFRREWPNYILSLYSVPEGSTDGCRNQFGAEMTTSIYLHFLVCLRLEDVKLLSLNDSNRRNTRAICSKRASRLRVMRLSLRVKSVFHINWLVYSVIDKLQSEKGQKGRERKQFVWLSRVLCSHISIFILTHFSDKKEEASLGVKLKAVSSKEAIWIVLLLRSRTDISPHTRLWRSDLLTNTPSGLRWNINIGELAPKSR